MRDLYYNIGDIDDTIKAFVRLHELQGHDDRSVLALIRDGPQRPNRLLTSFAQIGRRMKIIRIEDHVNMELSMLELTIEHPFNGAFLHAAFFQELWHARVSRSSTWTSELQFACRGCRLVGMTDEINIEALDLPANRFVRLLLEQYLPKEPS